MNLTQYFASILYTFELQFKMRVAVKMEVSGFEAPPKWNLPAYSTGDRHSVSDEEVLETLPDPLFVNYELECTTR